MNLSLSRPLLPSAVSLLAISLAFAGNLLSTPSRSQQTATAASEQTYSVTRIYKAGDIDNYHMKLNQKASVGGSGVDIKMNLVMKETTKTVVEGGEVTIVQEYMKADANIGGQDMDLMPFMPKLTLKKSKSGDVDVTAEGGQEPAVQQMITMAKAMMQSRAATLPTKPMKIGESWTTQLPGLSPDEKTTTTMTVKLDGIEVLEGVKALRLKSTTETTGGPQSDTKMHGDGTMFVDAATGKLLKMTTKADGTAKGSPVSTELLLEKARPEDLKPAKKESGPK